MINLRHHVFTTNRTTEERQDTPLLERRREQASRRWPGGAEARPVFGRDQFVPGGDLAQGGRGFRRGGGRLPHLHRLVLVLHFQGQMTCERILALLNGAGVVISKRRVVRL